MQAILCPVHSGTVSLIFSLLQTVDFYTLNNIHKPEKDHKTHDRLQITAFCHVYMHMHMHMPNVVVELNIFKVQNLLYLKYKFLYIYRLCTLSAMGLVTDSLIACLTD
jgi:hypothetical protein